MSELTGTEAALIDARIVGLYDEISRHLGHLDRIRLQYLLSQLHVVFIGHITNMGVRWLPQNGRHLTY